MGSVQHGLFRMSDYSEQTVKLAGLLNESPCRAGLSTRFYIFSFFCGVRRNQRREECFSEGSPLIDLLYMIGWIFLADKQGNFLARHNINIQLERSTSFREVAVLAYRCAGSQPDRHINSSSSPKGISAFDKRKCSVLQFLSLRIDQLASRATIRLRYCPLYTTSDFVGAAAIHGDRIFQNTLEPSQPFELFLITSPQAFLRMSTVGTIQATEISLSLLPTY